jgi:hypothetical protein
MEEAHEARVIVAQDARILMKFSSSMHNLLAKLTRNRYIREVSSLKGSPGLFDQTAVDMMQRLFGSSAILTFWAAAR